MTTAPTCGAQLPSPVPGPFDGPFFGAVAGVGAATAGVYALMPALLKVIYGVVGEGWAAVGTSAVAGAAAICALVLYFALKHDGCILHLPYGQAICVSGIVEDTIDESSSAAIAVLAPFAMGPAGVFDVVVKSAYWNYVAMGSYWVFCSPKGAAMLPCVIKSKTACGAKIGSVAGAAVGAIAGTVLGFIAGAATAAALGCTATFIFYLLCLLVALIVAAIVAAATTYVGATVGGWIGQAIAAAGSDPVGDEWKALEPGAIVTVKGNLVVDPNIGNNELYYTTDINRTGQFKHGPSYTTADADDTPPDDCPLVPPSPPGATIT